jgi:4-hydroxy-tetrahydrodipicolinate reductase
MSHEILISGASGTVGQALIELIEIDNHFRVAGLATREKFFEPDVDADVIIDFSHPGFLGRVLAYALRRGLPLIIGTTDLSDGQLESIRQASQRIAICHAANFSRGVTVLSHLVAQASRMLGPSFDIEISEMHHRRKLDAPSGTALALGHAAARSRGLVHADNAVFDRTERRVARDSQEIGYQVARGGDVVGEHTVYFMSDGERVELTHRATNRMVFARGALQAAARIIDQPPGMIEFADLLIE